MVGAFDDLDLPGTEVPHGGSRDFSLIAIGEDPLDERKHPTQYLEHEQPAIAILDVGRMNHDVQREAQRVDQDMSLLALDFLPRIITRRVDPRPPWRSR